MKEKSEPHHSTCPAIQQMFKPQRVCLSTERQMFKTQNTHLSIHNNLFKSRCLTSKGNIHHVGKDFAKLVFSHTSEICGVFLVIKVPDFQSSVRQCVPSNERQVNWHVGRKQVSIPYPLINQLLHHATQHTTSNFKTRIPYFHYPQIKILISN